MFYEEAFTCVWSMFVYNTTFVCYRENDRRQAAMSKSKQQQVDKEDAVSITTTRVEDKSPMPKDKQDKKKEAEVHIIASLPKPQSLPAHQLFKDKRKVYQVMRAVIDNLSLFLYSLHDSTHSGGVL